MTFEIYQHLDQKPSSLLKKCSARIRPELDDDDKD
jgi:hypothetical protein